VGQENDWWDAVTQTCLGRSGARVSRRRSNHGSTSLATKARGDHKIETYPARHGWVFRDTLVYAAERRWRTMSALFDAKLTHSP
jgi:hypothetical protein